MQQVGDIKIHVDPDTLQAFREVTIRVSWEEICDTLAVSGEHGLSIMLGAQLVQYIKANLSK
jgi:hypothetical protein